NIVHQLVREDIQTEASKSGHLTLIITSNNEKKYLHSRYNPENEAAQWIDEYMDKINEYDHVLFYGIGLGYHVEQMMAKHSEKENSLYDPYVYIFYQYLMHVNLCNAPKNAVKGIYVDFIKAMAGHSLNQIMEKITSKVLIVIN